MPFLYFVFRIFRIFQLLAIVVKKRVGARIDKIRARLSFHMDTLGAEGVTSMHPAANTRYAVVMSENIMM